VTRFRRFVCAFAVSFVPAVLTLRAERFFVGVLEADGYQSLNYGATAFGRVADLAVAAEIVDSVLLEMLALPSLSALAPGQLLRVIQTLDPDQPRGETNPAHVAIVPLAVTATAFYGLYGAAYESRRDRGPFICYEQPKSTNLPTRVMVAVSGRYALTSRSEEALAWVWENRTRLIDAPAQRIPGTLRLLVNPQRLADVLGAKTEQAAALFDFDRFIRDFEALSFSLSLDGQAIALTLSGTPLADSNLDYFVRALHPPSDRLWNGIPKHAFFASVSACSRPELWDTYLGKTRLRLLMPTADVLPPAAFNGEHLFFLCPTHDKLGLCFMHVAPVSDAAAAAVAITKMDGQKLDEGISLKRGPSRKSEGVEIASYEFVFPEPPAGAQEKPIALKDASVLYTLLALFLKDAVLECAVTDGRLITFIGPRQAFEGSLADLTFGDVPLTLRRRIGVQDAALSQDLCVGSMLAATALLKHLVAIMPGVRPEHLRVFPMVGDGATFGICCGEGRTLTASLRLQSNEIATLQHINREGRQVLQELFFQMFSVRLLNLHQPAIRPEFKKGQP